MNSHVPSIYSPASSQIETGSQEKGILHRLLLALAALTIASSAIVFSEPAPVDALMIVLIALLPAVGLVTIKPRHLMFLSAWLVIGAGGFASTMFASNVEISAIHTAVSVYLYASAFLISIFVAKSPEAHTGLVLNAYTAAAVIAAMIGLLGYFDLPSGSAEFFTKYGRASGPFKDPNVFGAFLTLAIVKLLHDAVTMRGMRILVSLAGLGILMLGVLLSFSRGAWAAAAVGIIVYSCLAFLTAKRNMERAKLVLLGLASAIVACLVVAVTLQSDAVAKLLEERASFSQSYDVGPEGRFGGQEKARELILENPLGIGAGTFGREYHTEDVHNVYLSMFLNAGWLGGFGYLALAVATVFFGLRHAFKRTATQPSFLVAYSALAAIILEGMIVDTDHWRHFYLMMGLVWGLMISDRQIKRRPRIVTDLRPVLLNPVLMLPPPRRAARALVPVHIALPAPRGSVPFPSRPARIKGPAQISLLGAPACKKS